MRTNAILGAVLLAAPVSAAVVPAPGGLTNIGVAAAVRGAVSALAPGAPAGRVIGSGKPVYLNDHVTTGANARLQILLLDETTFTLGPNSDMVLDEFVYDPATSSGKVTAEIQKGTFRFVTGQVARRKPADMKVKLPVGTIGIRGTMVEGAVDGGGADVLLTGPGPQNNASERPGGITVSNSRGSTDIDVSGFGTSIRGDGAPSRGYRFSADQLDRIHGQLSGESGAASEGGGGAAGRTASNGGPAGTATDVSGQGTASGGVNFQAVSGAVSAQNQDTANFASQQAGGQAVSAVVIDGPSTWDQILAIPSGTGQYQFSGTYTGCTACHTQPGAASGTFNSILPVNFATQQLGGLIGGRQGYISIGGSFSDSQNVNAIDMRAFAGQLPAGTRAILPILSNSLGASVGGGSFANSSIQFQSAGGTAGAAATLTVVYTNTSTDAGGAGQAASTKGPVTVP